MRISQEKNTIFKKLESDKHDCIGGIIKPVKENNRSTGAKFHLESNVFIHFEITVINNK